MTAFERVRGNAIYTPSELAEREARNPMTPTAIPADRWAALREHIRAERATLDETAAEHAEWGRDDRSERAYGAVEVLDRLLATMERMEADR